MLPNQASEKDMIIAVMGPTGAGKSTFIELATGQNGETVGHGLKSYTSDIRTVRVTHPRKSCPVLFVDTPGFDDTYKSDTEILSMIADWLVRSLNRSLSYLSHKQHLKLAGILYCHRISDNRMAGTSLKNLDMFQSLCGANAMRNVILVSTMWGVIKEEVGARREQELRGEYWKPMLDAGSRTARFKDSFESAWDLIDTLGEERRHVLLSKEMVETSRPLNETQAGITLYKNLEKLMKDQKEATRKLRRLAKRSDNPLLVQELHNEKKHIDEKIDETARQMKTLKIPFTQKMLYFFSSRKKLT